MRKYYKFEIDTVKGNILCILITIIAIIPAWNIMIKYIENINMKELGILIFAYLLWMFLHEILHGIGHIICGVKPKDLSFGASLEKSVLFCLVRREVNKKGILVSLIFPFFFIGIVTYIIGVIINSPLLISLSILNIGGASMDLTMFLQFIRLGEDITYIEPGDGTSFYLISNNNINKLYGLKKVEEGEYNKEMFLNKNNKVFDISKTSFLLLGIFFICCLILIFL